MDSIREIFRTGLGPSSSHTMAPARAAEAFLARAPDAERYRVTLYGSLASTGRGHMTDRALERVFAGRELEIRWRPEEPLPEHPNGLRFEALPEAGETTLERWTVFSIGGGALSESGRIETARAVYPLDTMQAILEDCLRRGRSFWEFVLDCEGPEILDFLAEVWRSMREAIDRGLETEGALPGPLGIARKACSAFRKARMGGEHSRRTALLSAYALAVSEENAAGGTIVTAPTCGSSGVLPAVLRYLQEATDCGENEVLRALATAGLVGALVRHNASISGAEVGCQGEVGAACAMGAAAVSQLLGGTVRQIEYAAETGLEHHLGLTCDPVLGLVQIPCIERNAFAACRAATCGDYSLLGDGTHRIPFDEVVHAMRQTGHDLPHLYRETAAGGLAEVWRRRGGSPA